MQKIFWLNASAVAAISSSFIVALPEILRCVLLALAIVNYLQAIARRKRAQAASGSRKRKVAITHLPLAALLVLLLLWGSGCSTTNLSEIVKAAALDTNHIELHISSPWGTADFKRNP